MKYVTKYTAEGRAYINEVINHFIKYKNMACFYNSNLGFVYKYLQKFGLYELVGDFGVIEHEDQEYKIMTEDAYNAETPKTNADAYKFNNKYFLIAKDGETLYMSESGMFYEFAGKINTEAAEKINFEELMRISQFAEENYINKMREEGKTPKEKF